MRTTPMHDAMLERRLPMTIVRLLDFVVGQGLRGRFDDEVLDRLLGHRIVVEYWVEPLIKGDDSKERVEGLTDWICAAAYAFVSGHATEAELREVGYVFRLYSPDGVTLLDTVTRTPPPR